MVNPKDAPEGHRWQTRDPESISPYGHQNHPLPPMKTLPSEAWVVYAVFKDNTLAHMSEPVEYGEALADLAEALMQDYVKEAYLYRIGFKDGTMRDVTQGAKLDIEALKWRTPKEEP